MVNSEKEFNAVVDKLLRCSENKPFDTAIIFGSGLGLSDSILEPFQSFRYPELSIFPETTVHGHEGRLVLSRFDGRLVLLFYGRSHLYEGLSAWEATVNVRLARALGCQRLLITNAAGGINTALKPGDIMFVRDHLNLLGDNPLRGLRDAFIDLSGLYNCSLYAPLGRYAESRDISFSDGVLAAVMGPSYETPAEIKMLKNLGADAVCMSGIPEAIIGKYLGMSISALSFITNQAAGCRKSPLTHEEVLEQARGKRGCFSFLVDCLLKEWWGTGD
jgi:purine-nucleoside phosphorylase